MALLLHFLMPVVHLIFLMFDISHDSNRFIFPAINKMSSPRLPQASSDPNSHSRVVPGRLRPLVPDLPSLVPGSRLLVPDSYKMRMNFMCVKVNRFHQSPEASDGLRCPGTQKSRSGTKPRLRAADPNRSKLVSPGHLGPRNFSL